MKFFDVEQEFGPAIEYLIHNYPNYVAIKNLPLDDEDEKVSIPVLRRWKRIWRCCGCAIKRTILKLCTELDSAVLNCQWKS